MRTIRIILAILVALMTMGTTCGCGDITLDTSYSNGARFIMSLPL